MEGSLTGIAQRVRSVGDKTKKYADIYYLASLFIFISGYACSMTKNVAPFVTIVLLAGEIMLLPIAFYRIIIAFFKNWKIAAGAVLIIAFAFVYSFFSSDDIPLTYTAYAIVGAMGVKADLVLLSGIGGNIVMILHNIFMSLFGEENLFVSEFQDRKYFFLGNNSFYLSRINNCSSTDLAAHYFWMMAAYLWVRGKKITTGEIFALGGLSVLIYILSASNTSLLCMGLILIFAFVLKIWPKIRSKAGDFKALQGLGKAVVICAKASFILIALVCILLAVFFSSSNSVFLKLNNLMHWRLGLGHRGFYENGVQLIATDVPNYGMATSAEGYFNFLDCSYVSILITGGILLFTLYMGIMTAVQIRHKKFVYGVLILAVCALSCIEEHHLSELCYNMFLLLLFADFNLADKTGDAHVMKKSLKNIVNIGSFVICGVFLIISAFVFYPIYKSIKDLDELDNKAEEIYLAVNENLDIRNNDGSWDAAYSDMNSLEYGYVLSKPADFYNKTGLRWDNAVSDPKSHSYYAITYDGTSGSEYGISDVLISDKVKSLIGSGSAVIEYDAVSREVYAVWYKESSGCRELTDGRLSNRIGRLRNDVPKEGYYAGDHHG